MCKLIFLFKAIKALLILVDVHSHINIEQASVITDIIVLYVIKGRHFYREKKYDHAIKPKKTHESHAGSSAEQQL